MCYRCDGCDVVVTVAALTIQVPYPTIVDTVVVGTRTRGHQVCPSCKRRVAAGEDFHSIRADANAIKLQLEESFRLKHLGRIENDRRFSNKKKIAQRMGVPDPFAPLAALATSVAPSRPAVPSPKERKPASKRKPVIQVMRKPTAIRTVTT